MPHREVLFKSHMLVCCMSCGQVYLDVPTPPVRHVLGSSLIEYSSGLECASTHHHTLLHVRISTHIIVISHALMRHQSCSMHSCAISHAEPVMRHQSCSMHSCGTSNAACTRAS